MTVYYRRTLLLGDLVYASRLRTLTPADIYFLDCTMDNDCDEIDMLL